MERYQIIETLGTGTFGKVKLSVHIATNCKVALKFLDKTAVCKEDMLLRVEREVDYLKLLRHPHIIKLYEVLSTPVNIVMVFEYANNELFSYIAQKGRLAEEEGRRLFQQLVSAVEHCHRHSIVHRDLKPENLLLDSSFNLKIADFGLSNAVVDGDFLNTFCGSPSYAAPEIIAGKMYAGPEIDIWSMGIVLYVMLAGKLPFDEAYTPALFCKISQGIYSIPTYFSDDSKSLLQKMLVVDPLKRISIVEIKRTPFFYKSLPEYLRSFDNSGFLPSSVDAELVSKLTEMMFISEETVNDSLLRSFAQRNDLLLNITNSEYNVNDHKIFVAYSLLMDTQNQKQLQPSFSGRAQAFKLYRSNAWDVDWTDYPGFDDESEVVPLTSSLVQVLSTLSKPYTPQLSETPQTSGLLPMVENNYVFGISLEKHPQEIMQNLFIVMQNLNITVTLLNKYHFHGVCSTEVVTEFEVQIFKAHDKYLIDFKLVPNSHRLHFTPVQKNNVTNVLIFLNLCAQIIKSLLP